MINLLCYLCNTSQQNLASSTFNFICSSMNQAAHKNYIQPDEQPAYIQPTFTWKTYLDGNENI